MISTPLTRGETRCPDGNRSTDCISIHSPHARGDATTPENCDNGRNFNPLPSYEGRPASNNGLIGCLQFQSTPLIRGETRLIHIAADDRSISIHSPHARGDPVLATPLDAYSIFQSAPLSRGETKSIIGRDDAEHISIRSPHARGDLCRLRKWGIKIYFNPLPSHEGRPPITR